MKSSTVFVLLFLIVFMQMLQTTTTYSQTFQGPLLEVCAQTDNPTQVSCCLNNSNNCSLGNYCAGKPITFVIAQSMITYLDGQGGPSQNCLDWDLPGSSCTNTPCGDYHNTIVCSYSVPGTYNVTAAIIDIATGNTVISGQFAITITPGPQPIITGNLTLCLGSPTTLDAGAPYSSYLWSTGATSQTIQVWAGTYTVTVTDNQGCIGSSSVTVNPAIPITLSFIVNDATYCGATGSATVIASGGTSPYQYLWSTGATTQSINDPYSGNFTVTVTDANGCTRIGNVNINYMWPDFPPEINGPTSACSANGYIYSISNLSQLPSNTSFIWYLNGLQVGTGVSITLGTVPSPGDIIYVIATDNGCDLQSSNITIQDCCHLPNYLELNDYTVNDFFDDFGPGNPNINYDGLTPYGGNSPQPNILINGTFIWDGFHAFQNCNIKFGSGARILNTTGHTIRFENCILEAGCGVLWQGIELKVGSNIQVTGTSIKDAYYAIWQRKPSSMSLKDVTFDNNYIGVKYGHFGFNFPVALPIVSFIPGVYTRVNFFGNGVLLPSYPGIVADPTLPGTKPYAGVHAQFVYNLEFYNEIVFGDPTATTNNRLNSGIICINGGLNVHTFWDGTNFHGVHFGNIIADPAYGIGVPNSCAIYASGDPREVGGSLTIEGLIGTTLPNIIGFNHCGIGVYSERMFMNRITSNYMDDVNRAVYIGNAYGQLAVSDNILYVNRRGIELAYCSPMTTPTPGTTDPAINIIGNSIELGTNSANNSQFGKGFYMYEAPGNTDPADAYMYLNQIGVTVGLYGYHLQNVHNSFLTYCNSWLGFNGRQFGIKLETCRNITMQCSGHQTPVPLYTASQPEHYGSFVRGSRDCVWDCNYFGFNFRDMHWVGDCKSSDIRGNWMDDASDCGYYLATNAVTGKQILNGNIWIDPDAGASHFPTGRAAVNSNGVITSTEVEVDPNLPLAFGSNYYWYPNYNNSGNPGNTTPGQGFWFYDNSSIFTYECGSLCWVQGPHDERLTVDSLVAADSTLTSEYIPESKKIMQQDLFEKLRADATLLNSSLLFQQFYTSKLNTNTNLFAEAKEDINVAIKQQLLLGTLNALMLEVQDRTESISYNDSILNYGTLTVQEITMLENADSVLRAELDSLMNLAIVTKHDLQDNLVVATNDIYGNVSAISDNDLIEYNHRIVYEVYLNTVARGIFVFTPQQESDLLSIAIQCPDVGGEAVIDARIIYDRVNPEMDYDDNATCTPYGYFRTSQNSNSFVIQQDVTVFSLYPNPASEKIRVSYTLRESSELSFYSATGQRVYSVILKSGSKIEEINTASFNEGAYSWKLQTGSTTKNGKLFIIK